jgi:hypothetical protein
MCVCVCVAGGENEAHSMFCSLINTTTCVLRQPADSRSLL